MLWIKTIFTPHEVFVHFKPKTCLIIKYNQDSVNSVHSSTHPHLMGYRAERKASAASTHSPSHSEITFNVQIYYKHSITQPEDQKFIS